MNALSSTELYRDDQGRIFKIIKEIKGGSQGKIYEIAYKDAQIRHSLHPYIRFIIKQEIPTQRQGNNYVIQSEINALNALKNITNLTQLTGTAFERTALIRPFYAEFKGQLMPISSEILNTIEQIHRQGFIHGDIKIEHIMYDAHRQHWVLADFGSSQRIDAFNIDTFESTFVQQNDLRKQLSQEFRPEIIDLYCFALMIYRHLGGDERRLPWRKMSFLQHLTRQIPYSPLPFQVDIDGWNHVDCAHSHDEIRELFRQACIDEPQPDTSMNQNP